MKKVVSIIIIIICFIVLYGLYDYLFVVHYTIIDLNDNKTEVNEEYKDPGIKAKYRGKQVKNIDVENDINIHKLGYYNIVYKI